MILFAAFPRHLGVRVLISDKVEDVDGPSAVFAVSGTVFPFDQALDGLGAHEHVCFSICSCSSVVFA